MPNEQKLKTFKNDKIYFKISNYGSISRNVEKLEKTLKKKYALYNRENYKMARLRKNRKL